MLTGIVFLLIIVPLNEVSSIRKESALDAFKLFYEELIIVKPTSRIKRNRPLTAD